MSFSKAYEKMFKDGSAYKPIRIKQPTPDNADGTIGESFVKESKKEVEDVEWNQFDSQVRDFVKTKRSESKPIPKSKSMSESKTIQTLEKRIELLEGIVEKIMKSQMSILKNG